MAQSFKEPYAKASKPIPSAGQAASSGRSGSPDQGAKLAATRRLDPKSRIVLFNTGTGFKYVEAT